MSTYYYINPKDKSYASWLTSPVLFNDRISPGYAVDVVGRNVQNIYRLNAMRSNCLDHFQVWEYVKLNNLIRWLYMEWVYDFECWLQSKILNPDPEQHELVCAHCEKPARIKKADGSWPVSKDEKLNEVRKVRPATDREFKIAQENIAAKQPPAYNALILMLHHPCPGCRKKCLVLYQTTNSVRCKQCYEAWRATKPSIETHYTTGTTGWQDKRVPLQSLKVQKEVTKPFKAAPRRKTVWQQTTRLNKGDNVFVSLFGSRWANYKVSDIKFSWEEPSQFLRAVVMQTLEELNRKYATAHVVHHKALRFVDLRKDYKTNPDDVITGHRKALFDYAIEDAHRIREHAIKYMAADVMQETQRYKLHIIGHRESGNFVDVKATVKYTTIKQLKGFLESGDHNEQLRIYDLDKGVTTYIPQSYLKSAIIEWKPLS